MKQGIAFVVTSSAGKKIGTLQLVTRNGHSLQDQHAVTTADRQVVGEGEFHPDMKFANEGCGVRRGVRSLTHRPLQNGCLFCIVPIQAELG